jgi:hypothetical protein
MITWITRDFIDEGFFAKPRRRSATAHERITFLLLAFTILLGAATALFFFAPQSFLPTDMGPADGLRWRLLRLARVSAIALPVLTLLFVRLSSRADPGSRAARWGGGAMSAGAVLMPAILAAAALTRVEVRFLLPLPAGAVFFGTLCGLRLSRRHALRLETWGWLLIAASMGAGLFMGLYAFDLPLLPVNPMGDYNDLSRRLVRHAHVAAILSGFPLIFFSRRTEKRGAES